ncbi:hypothetical protein GCM10023063_33230 [Arthrobacter methylotrophus]
MSTEFASIRTEFRSNATEIGHIAHLDVMSWSYFAVDETTHSLRGSHLLARRRHRVLQQPGYGGAVRDRGWSKPCEVVRLQEAGEVTVEHWGRRGDIAGAAGG